jgi:hypothetical protein
LGDSVDMLDPRVDCRKHGIQAVSESELVRACADATPSRPSVVRTHS